MLTHNKIRCIIKMIILLKENNKMEFETDRSKTCTFIGHRTIEKTDALAEKVTSEIRRLITKEGYDTFLLGSKSLFNDLCMDILSELKKEYPHIRRIYVRAEYPVIKDDYKEFLMTFCDETCYPETLVGAGRAVYVKRNRIMLDMSSVCIGYYRKEDQPKNRKSGTKLALEYAQKCGVNVISV